MLLIVPTRLLPLNDPNVSLVRTLYLLRELMQCLLHNLVSATLHSHMHVDSPDTRLMSR